ncbi:DUF664 domain-containing protein [Rhodococcus kroppenstedtii]|uniref:mycothiol transferase n=1 Tax=Rhodococcoides kroppenstedtii TaxID=293050 RepID=UPI001C9B0F55|nr:DUF664 domain-containing protein [Rhodococcus kroppenstedtii]MBY6436406.1 DUF664 domain-containing protein [Rhodococcus kroppenstedtii]
MAGFYTSVTPTVDVVGEKLDLLSILADQRALLALTARGLTDEQARRRTTVSEFTLGSLIKHVAVVLEDNVRLLRERDETATVDLAGVGEGLTFGPDESLDQWLEALTTAGVELERYVADLDGLDGPIPQPTAPWAPERVVWSARRVLLHVLREVAHHCGHADMVREALDGQTTMGALTEGMDIDWDPSPGGS